MAVPRSSFGISALLCIVIALGAAGVFGGRVAAAADADDQDLKARKLFAAGDYRQALDIYVNLYAETLHPTYLRNIGRCQQNLGEADKAIGSFREYLRKAKDLTPTQRQEIEGHIAEMEELKRKQASSGGTAASPGAGSPSAAGPPASTDLRAAPATAGPAPSALLSSPAAAPSSSDDGASPFYTRAWFWIVVGAVAAGSVGAFLLLRDDGGNGPLDMLDLRGKTSP